MYIFKSLKPNIVNDKFINFEFPNGRYNIDCIYFKISFNGEVIPKNLLFIADLIKEIVTYHD